MERPALDAPAADWLVYGDSLQDAGDPRGELVGLSHGIDEGRTSEAQREAFVREHGAALLGAAKAHLEAYRFAWRYCELIAAEVHVKPSDDAEVLVRALLDAPVAPRLSQLTLVGHAEPEAPVDLAPAMAVLAAAPRITGLGLVDERARRARMLVSRDYEPDPNLVQLGPLAPFWPRLERLRLVVADAQQLDLSRIDAPELRELVLHNLRYGDWGIEAGPLSSQLAAARWPKLAALELRLTESWVANVPLETAPYVPVYTAWDDDEAGGGGEDDAGLVDPRADEGDIEPVEWDELADLLANVKQCPLHRLALTNFVGGASLIETLGEAGVAPTLVELDLSHSELGDEDVDRMFDHLPAFSNLARMVLDGTHVTEAALARLRALGIEVVKDGSPPGAKWRYVVGQE